jgi:uncharacterized protein (TIGR02266 family)
MEDRIEVRASPRVSLEAEIRIEFSSMSAFVSEVVTNISVGGMFVTTDRPGTVGERFRFELALGSRLRLVSGVAEVVWVRAPNIGSPNPPGMGVRFVELDDISRSIIFRIVDRSIQEAGVQPFDLDGRPASS